MRVYLFMIVIFSAVCALSYGVSLEVREYWNNHQESEAICFKNFKVFDYKTVKGDLHCKVNGQYILVNKDTKIEE